MEQKFNTYNFNESLIASVGEGERETHTPISHVRLNPMKHIHCGLVHFQKDTIEDLFKKE